MCCECNGGIERSKEWEVLYFTIDPTVDPMIIDRRSEMP